MLNSCLKILTKHIKFNSNIIQILNLLQKNEEIVLKYII